MTKWQIALVREQGIEFAVASVKDSVLQNKASAESLIASLTVRLNRPTVLIGARDHRLFGRHDIVRFLQHVHPSRLPWSEVTIAA